LWLSLRQIMAAELALLAAAAAAAADGTWDA